MCITINNFSCYKKEKLFIYVHTTLLSKIYQKKKKLLSIGNSISENNLYTYKKKRKEQDKPKTNQNNYFILF